MNSEDTKRIPFLISITGHRDILPDHENRLIQEIQQIIREIKQRVPDTPLVILSALAEGADMLAAKAAIEEKIQLHVILPYDQNTYMDSFDDKSNIEVFNDLIERSSRKDTLACASSDKKNCYKNLGQHLADHCNILIALWDGNSSSKEGGTSWVVTYKKEGKKGNQFAHCDGNAVYHIHTPRRSNPVIDDPFAVEKNFLGTMDEKEFFDSFSNINQINCEMASKITFEATLSEYINYFDRVAVKNQKAHDIVLVTIVVLVWCGIVSLEILHNFQAEKFLWGYGSAILLAYGIHHFWAKRSAVQNRFIYSRGIAEALRIQDQWKKNAILETAVADHYLENHGNAFVWIRNLLKNIEYQVTGQPSGNDINRLKTDWFDEQIRYFDHAIESRTRKLHRLEIVERLFYTIGLVATAIMFACFFVEELHLNIGLNHQFVSMILHKSIFVSGVFLLTAAFIDEKYIKMKGYKEEIVNFRIMRPIFINAKKLLEAASTEGEKKSVIFDLGIKALEENSKWLVSHDKRRLKPGFE